MQATMTTKTVVALRTGANMQWQRTGQQLAGLYMQQSYSGLVVDSRVKYGGRVQHTVVLDQPIEVFGSRRDQILVDEEEIILGQGLVGGRGK